MMQEDIFVLVVYLFIAKVLTVVIIYRYTNEEVLTFLIASLPMTGKIVRKSSVIGNPY